MKMKKYKKGDKIIITVGKDKGRKSEIVKIIPKKGLVVAKGINIYKKHTKPQGDAPGGIKEIERPIPPSKFMVLDESGKPARVGFKVTKSTKSRINKKSGKKI